MLPIMRIVKRSTIRTSIDLPRGLHRKLHEEAARKGWSARRLILAAIAQAIEPPRRTHGRLDLERPLVRLRKPVQVTNEKIYELGLP